MYFGGDTINIDEEIAVGIRFSWSENHDVKVEMLTPVREDANQESKSADSSVQEVTDPGPSTRFFWVFCSKEMKDWKWFLEVQF